MLFLFHMAWDIFFWHNFVQRVYVQRATCFPNIVARCTKKRCTFHPSLNMHMTLLGVENKLAFVFCCTIFFNLSALKLLNKNTLLQVINIISHCWCAPHSAHWNDFLCVQLLLVQGDISNYWQQRLSNINRNGIGQLKQFQLLIICCQCG